MRLLFKPRDGKYLGSGELPFGNYEDTSRWEPITNSLEKGAVQFPSKAMFRVGDPDGNIVESYTYRETNEWANRVSNGLIKDYGVSKGTKVGMYMLNSSQYVVSIIAIHKAGAVQVPINKDEKGERLAYVINYSDMKVLIIDEGSVPFIQDIAADLQNLEVIFVTSENVPERIGNIKALPFSAFNNYDSSNPNIPVSVDDMERCMFTSGTTGMPKGVARDHGGVVMTVRSYLQQQGVRSEDTLMYKMFFLVDPK